MTDSPLPNEEQRKQLSELIAEAFIDLRHLEGEQAHDLANTMHNLPREIYGWGNWNVEWFRERLVAYQTKHRANLGFDYVAAFNDIYPD